MRLKNINWSIFTQTAEGRAFCLGITLLLLFFAGLGWISFQYPHYASLLLTSFMIRVGTGRAPGLYAGFMLGLDPKDILLIHFLIEATWVLIYYPLVYFGMQKMLVFERAKKNIERIHALAHKHHKWIERYGLLGVFFFVAAPLPFTGPLIGNVIAYFMGVRPWRNMLVVIAAACLTVSVWCVVVLKAYTAAVTVSPNMSYIVFGVLLVLLVGIAVSKRFMQKD